MRSFDEECLRRPRRVTSILICFAVFVTVMWWILSSAMEANTYWRLTGKRVTTWDAMWVDLRIQEKVAE